MFDFNNIYSHGLDCIGYSGFFTIVPQDSLSLLVNSFASVVNYHLLIDNLLNPLHVQLQQHLFTWPGLYWFFWIFDEDLRFISMDEVAKDYVVITYTASRSLKTHHYCILWLQSTFVIYAVLNPYHMMYSNIVKELVFQYIEHGILRYEFVYNISMYLFQVLYPRLQGCFILNNRCLRGVW